jgi:nitrite reductase (NADH) large subunit
MNMISPRRTRLVLVGNGMGGVRALEEILARAPHEFAITVFGAEPHGNYNRIMLSPVLTGEKTFEAITTHPRSWYDDNDIELIAGESVVGIDRAAKTAIGALGTARSYDVLILATGSNPIIIPVPDHTLSGVIGFRDTADVEAMLAASRSGMPSSLAVACWDLNFSNTRQLSCSSIARKPGTWSAPPAGSSVSASAQSVSA